MRTVVVAVLVPPIHTNKPTPSVFPIAKAISILEKTGILTVFGFTLFSKNNTVWINGSCINNNEFIDIESHIDIIHDRFPSQIRNKHFQRLKMTSKDTLFGNPVSLTLLCRDKLRCQRLLEDHGCILPETIDNFDNFHEHLQKWNIGYLKPQFGALGKGVEAVTPGMTLKSHVEGVVPGKLEPTLLQRGIDAPTGWKGMSVRQLMQRDISGLWIPRTAVLRRSRNNSVVNVSKGAEAVPAEDFLPSDTIQSIQQQSLQVCRILSATSDGLTAVEFGLDFVVASDYRPWLIEVNSRPRGRLEVLTEREPNRFESEHIQACIQPIRYLASLC